MTDMNSVNLVGNLVRDMDMNTTATGFHIGRVTLAVNRSVKHGDQWEDEASFIDVNIFGKTAENLQQYLKKGTKLGVSGHLKQDTWEKDGQRHSKLSVNADNVFLFGGRNGSSSGNENTGNQSRIPF